MPACPGGRHQRRASCLCREGKSADVGRIGSTTVLGKVHVEIRRPPCLSGVMTQRTRSSGRSGEGEDVQAQVVDDLTGGEGTEPGPGLGVLWIAVNATGRR